MTTSSSNRLRRTETKSGRRRRLRNRAILIVVAALVLTTIGWGGYTLLRSCGGFGSGVSTVDGECIGVTDGRYVFDQNYRDVENKIANANAEASRSGNAVTVALLEPFTVTETSPLTVDEVRHELEGAYTAQWRANNTYAIDDPQPKIRLVLANEGSHEGQWKTTVDQLIGMTHDSAPLVAVAGMGVSLSQTMLGAQKLSEQGIPTVGGIVTADEINGARIPGFVRVEPNDQEFVASLNNYLKQHTELSSGLVVYDNNADDNTDLYAKSLRDNLSNGVTSRIRLFDPLNFKGVSVPSDANPDLFINITNSICGVRPNLVLYSGRQVDLISFLKSLENRACRETTPLTVATAGTDLSKLSKPATMQQLKNGNLKVVFASSTDAKGWSKGIPNTPAHFAEFRSAFVNRGFAQDDIVDGDAIATHDAVLTAVKAIRLAYGSALVRNHVTLPHPRDVGSQLLNLNNQSSVVPAAAGDIRFAFRGGKTGEPINKPIPVLTIPPGEQENPQDVYVTK